MSRRCLTLAAALLGASAGLAAGFLVDGAWVEARLGHPELVVLHAEKNPGSFAAGHIPGARRVQWKEIATRRDRLTNELPTFRKRRELLTRLGVPSRGPIVVYGDGIGVAAGRLVLLLDSLDLADRVHVLDGHFQAWVADGRPVSKVTPTFPVGRFRGGQAPEVVARAPEVARLVEEGAHLLDARPTEQFTGEVPGGSVLRPGHIPGARSVPAPRLLAEGEVPRLRPAPELRALLGIQEPEKPVITYCRTGGAAALHYLALRSLEVETRFYDGSFIDWSRHTELPVER